MNVELITEKAVSGCCLNNMLFNQGLNVNLRKC